MRTDADFNPMTSNSQGPNPARSLFSTHLRRARPGQLQTNFQPQTQHQPQLHHLGHGQHCSHVHYSSAPSSAPFSATPMAPSPRLTSPVVMSPDAAALTRHSSIQPSPEFIPRPREEDQQHPTSFQLPDSVLSPRTTASATCLPTSLWSAGASPDNGPHGSALSATSSHNGPSSTMVGSSLSHHHSNSSYPAPASKTNLIRRLSSRASRRIASSRRRQSSAAPASRDGSVGPCYLRRRSDSNATAPPDCLALSTDSESDLDERDDFASIGSLYFDGCFRGSSANSTTESIAGSANNMAGPVIPLQLQRGTWLRKISKKNRSKRVRLVYEPETNKLMWDRLRPNKFLHVDEIREIRTGTDIQQYGRDFNVPESERSTWFSILYAMPDKSKTKFLHLIADDVETCFTWTIFLDALLKHRQEVMASLMTFNDRAMAQFWQSEMAKQSNGDLPRPEDSEELDAAGVSRVCQNLHIYSSQATVQANFRLCDARRRGRLNFNEFLAFVRLMRQRTDVQRIMRAAAVNPEAGLTLSEFLAFLRDTQGEDVSAANVASWERQFIKFVRKYRPGDADHGRVSLMPEAAFAGFLASRHNGPLIEEPSDYKLDRPMNEYFISSSHNTYLLGRQVAGHSSVEGYISALARGCRCVEVDCWDGSDGHPQVVHGRTLTTAISFKEVMTTINKYAFVKSSYPLWISLEVHCCPAQQALMAETMKEAFGARLVTEPLDGSVDKLPSPSQLMERVLVKVKKPGGNHDNPSAPETPRRRRGRSLSSPAVRPPASESASLPQSPLLLAGNSARRLVGGKNRVNTITEGQVHELLSSSDESESGSETGFMGRSANKTTKVLGSLGVYCAGVKYFGFDTPEAKSFNHIFSFMESSFARHSRTKESKMALDMHNMRYMMRVYPDGMRFASSNYDPLIYWRRGVQMAALNWQTFDLGSQLNHAMFTGGCDESGYVLKPTELRDIQVRPFDSAIAEGKKERTVVSFSIDVISAQQLMRPANLAAGKSMDPYVEVQVLHANDKRDKKEAGSTLIHVDDSPLRFRTEVVRENGFNPVFPGGSFKFRVTTKHPELVFVRWSVKLASHGEGLNSKDGAAIGTYTAKLQNLKRGYRTLPLLNHAGDQYLFSTLFCHISDMDMETRLFDASPAAQEGGKLNRLGGKVFGRSSSSPRSTFESSSTS
ncbi:phosphoinositide-specific phospholipase C [Ophiocordyceps camponoti-floridani]|uniref:Phosphoinositide phospholipase C n=1 Tax=Ophiocordyceps camponoti-floridani TaxID=2030778 RepID=A0A8H4VEK7_9HYPO|nr:phosphoinositide-specific phospholipase C [Ophiocordyceps camponoti-floridani]